MGVPLHSVPREAGEGSVSDAPARFEDFFRERYGQLFAGLCLITGSRQEAEELAQEAFVRILERWDRVVSFDDPGGYLFTTAMNLFRKRYRRGRLLDLLPMLGRESDDAFGLVDERDALLRALRDLPPRQRAAVVLTAMFDLPSEEAGRLMGISDSTVRVLAKRARTELRAIVGDEG